jgi:fatty-acyl-CoA synthase
MADFRSRIRELMTRPPSTLGSARVLRRAGVLRPGRPDEALRALRTVRRYGVYAGTVKIAVRDQPDAIGIVDDLGVLNFRQLDRRSNALARAWQRHGITDRDVIGVLCRNHRWFLETMLAAAKLGADVVLLNTGFGPAQLASVAAREGISTIVYDQEFSPVVAATPQVRRYLAWVDAELLADAPILEILIANTDDEDLPPPGRPGRMVLLTSGTTGTPKGAPRRIRSALTAAEFLDRIPYRRSEATMIVAPLFHATGVSQMAVMLALGSTTVLSRRFDPGTTLDRIQRFGCTGLVLVPTMLRRILDLGDGVLARYDTGSLRVLLCSGSALSTELGNRAVRAFGGVLYNLYGSTEAAVATVATPWDWHRAPGTVGRPPIGCRVRLFDDAGNPVSEPYQRGRIFVGSMLTFGGYSDGAGKDELHGLVNTGDVGHLDREGLLFVDGRADDMIISGGENVYPGEVEDLLMTHPDIVEAAVVGVPDPDFGERLKAFVVTRPGAYLPPEAIQQHVRQHLARYKVPREVVYLGELPRNATGKVVRQLLR